MSNTALLVIMFVAVFESLIIIVGNSFTILVFWEHRNRLKRTSLLLTNLAIVGLLGGITEPIALMERLISLNMLKKPTMNSIKYGDILSPLHYFLSRQYISLCTHFSGTCICFNLASLPSSSKY